MTGVVTWDDECHYHNDLKISGELWEEVQDLSDTIFVVDIAREISEFYNPAIASELGGYIHIHDKTEKVIYSYHLNDKTIVRSPMPSSVLPSSHISMWECRLEDEGREAKFIVDSKQEKDETVVALITDNVVEASESRLLDIPLDVLEMIMKLCVGVEYMNFRATCTRCHLAAPLIQWRNQKALHNYSFVSPSLMVVDQIRGIITFTDPMMGDRYFMRCPHLSIFDEAICCSRFGWLLFKNSNLCPTFFNPFTNDLLELPCQYYYIYKLWFSAPPTSSECMVVGFSSKKIVILNVALEQTWRVFDLDPKDLILSSVLFPTFHNGDLYTLFSRGQLRVFKDLSEADISETFQS
uniref:F-box/kelch-repeat protein At1g57790-like n=1 Tax=Erigeron canadensis TaxID=72917 RepID=UPI001CB90AE8|nr:F-box/kelch-repeat protein At1g57790-like [Erigeron canadensis]XP_043610337.1 F-box/kelch-repeat protein At1g57790-like [Erigeron canadensis]